MIFPPDTVGVLGGGQLGLFFLCSARRQGYRTVVWDPDISCPARACADVHICLPYDNSDAYHDFSGLCKAATVEFENVPVDLLSSLATKILISPSADAVEICANRVLEKSFLKTNGFPVVDYFNICSESDCELAPKNLFPAILKTAQMGYDGRGQLPISDHSKLLESWRLLGVPCVLEKRLSSGMAEFSIVVGRSHNGQVVFFPITKNFHKNGILVHCSTACYDYKDVFDQIYSIAALIVEKLSYCGVLAVEFFYDQGELYVNEMAPRPHNTGHYTMDATSYSQFDCQQRILCGLDIFQPRQLSDSMMVNLLGDGWLFDDPIQWPYVMNQRGRLYLYGKTEVRPGRKMGHVTWVGKQDDFVEEALKFYQWFYYRGDK
ncbi:MULTISPECIES: 5-(carboxyamino)imidazole ribonucleotide synthase [Candidatus Ichthyocystis]|uniref:N5-carboxyaminoimidazole ribonucleotide synthase n=1 Tax=Candidatus Ichthyocystis hellenicum TaxID=1561003 RepID=A0A0S4LZY2_9BURK|nr:MULTISPECIES: ATP-grasp domain-containing protein [Ichthyocystis]CUT16913.1 N5-carboxyaminoimidazole ribonucleotide synthase [Candidatus Ichthyocystis hellenicum]